jgi:hypothetical protein
VTAPAQPEITGRASRRVLLFGVALAAAVAVTALPLPWRLSGLGFAGLAAWTGVRVLLDLTARRRTGQPVSGWLGVTVGLGLAVFLALLFGAQAAFYPLLVDQERCLSGAITYLDREQCRTAFEQRQEEIMDRLSGTP